MAAQFLGMTGMHNSAGYCKQVQGESGRDIEATNQKLERGRSI